MSIATKTGDKGDTSLVGGERVRKTDPRIEAYGTVDELNACIGVALAYMTNSHLKTILTTVQHDLFTIGAELASITSKKLTMDLPRVSNKHLDSLDAELLVLEQQLPAQTSFILPNGTPAASHLHLARTICRRAERRVVECAQQHELNIELLKYLNRLSDYLFLCARKENQGHVAEEKVRYA